MTEPTITIRCHHGAVVVGDRVLTFGDHILTLTEAEDVFIDGALAFDAGILEQVDGSTVRVVLDVPKIASMSVRDVREGIARDAWPVEVMEAMLADERGGKGRKGVVERLTDATSRDVPSGPVNVDVG